MSDGELVDVVDEEGRTVGVVSRREMRARRLPHRSAYVLVFNRTGHLFIHLRVPTKDVYPGHWDVAVEPLFPVRWADEHTIVHGMAYRAVHEGPFRLQPEEVVRGEFLPLEQVEERAAWEPFCPDGMAVVREYRARLD